ncbi:MAG: hypothetical protein N3C13_05515 [Aquificaceae bacterium]|nr:hypothetical protein [Aquificaceae bacterium]
MTGYFPFSKQEGADASGELQAILGEGSKFEGNLKLSGGLVRLDGSVRGDVTGKASVERLAVYGLIKGSIVAREVELSSGRRHHGGGPSS